MSRTALASSSSPTRLISAAALAAALAIAGCSAHDKGDTSSSSVQTSQITRSNSSKDQRNVMYYPTGDKSSSVISLQQVAPGEMRVGENYTYRVKVTNLTDKPLQNVILRTDNSDNFKITATDPQLQQQNGQLAYNLGSLGPKEERDVTITGVPQGQGEMRQTYTVAWAGSMSTAISAVAPKLALTKQGPAEADVCQGITWHYVAQNTGTGTVHNVVLHDQLPDGLTTAKDGQNVVTANLGDIPAGQSRDATAQLKAARAGSFASTASVSSDAGEAQSAAVTTVARQPKLELTLDGPQQEYLGKPIVYNATVKNTGDAPARNATLKLAAPEGVQLVSVTDASGAQLAGAREGNGAGSLGTIDPGQSRQVKITYQGNQGGTLKLDADAVAQCSPDARQTVQTSIIALPALLLETTDAHDPVKVGDNVVYIVKVTNQGQGPDTNVKVTATIPDGEQFVDAKGSTDASNSGQTINFAPIPTLNAKQSAEWKVTVKAARAGDVQFRTTATSDSNKAGAEKAEPTKLY